MSTTKAALKAAKAALDSQQYGEAVLQARNVLDSDPQNYYGNVFLGRALEKQGNADGAADAYRAATKLKPAEELAWKGLCNVFENRGSERVKQYCDAATELAKVYAEQSDLDQCRSVVDKAILFAKQNGSRREYVEALKIYLPTSPVYDFLEGRIPNPGATYAKIADITDAEETERINKEIGERRTRLGARLGQVKAEVKREVFRTSDLEQLFQSVIDWTNDDEIRRHYEEKLFQRAYDHLEVLPTAEKAEKRAQVMKLAREMVIIKHPFELAWRLYLEWSDFVVIEELDKNVLLEYMEKFPDSGLSKVLQGALGLSLSGEEPHLENGNAEANGELVPESRPIFSPEERLILVTDGIQERNSSAFGARLVADYYLQIEEYESCAEMSRQALKLLQVERQKSGLALQKNVDGVKIDLATSLIYFQSPKNHPEAKTLFDEILESAPESTPALLGIGLIHEEQEDYKEASSFLEKALLRDPDNVRIAIEAGWCRALNGDLQGGLTALEQWQPLIDLKSPHGWELRAQTSYRIGRCLWDLHNDKASRKDRKSGPYSHFLAAIKANPNLAPAYTSLGFFYANYAKDPKRARQCFQKAFELSALEVQAAEQLAQAFANDGDWDVVQVISQRVVDSGLVRPPPGSKRKGVSWPLAALGVVHINKQEYPQSVVSFQSALRISPQDYHSWVGLGEAYHSSGRYNAAQKSLEHAQSLQSDLAKEHESDAWFAEYMLANVHRELGDHDEAIQGYKSVLKSRPGEFGVSLALLQTLVERSSHDIETGFFGAAADSAREALVFALDVPIDQRGRFNYWKAIGDACAVYYAIPALVDKFPSKELESLKDSMQWTSIESLVELDQAPDEDVSEEEELPVSALTESLSFAVSAYKEAISIATHDRHAEAVAWYNLGWAEYRLYSSNAQDKQQPGSKSIGRYARAAVKCFKRAIELEASNAEFWNALGVATTTLNSKVSQHSFIRSLHLNERSARTWTNLGALYLLRNDPDLAHTAFGRAQATDPDYAYAWLGEGLIALTLGDFNEALAHFTHAVEIADATAVPVKTAYVRTAFDRLVSSPAMSNDLADLVQPIFALQQLQTQMVSLLPYCHLLGLLNERVNDRDAAVAQLSAVCDEVEQRYEASEAASDMGQFAMAKADLARNQLAVGDVDSAAENAEMALDLSGDEDPAVMTSSQRQRTRLSAHITAGLAKYHLEAMDEAMTLFRAALEESDSAPDVVCMLAQVLWAKGVKQEKEAATDLLFECIEKHPGNVPATSLLGATSCIDSDEATQDAVSADLNSLRAENNLTAEQRQRIDYLLNQIAAAADSESDSDEGSRSMAQSQISIMLSPANPAGWTMLSSCISDAYPKEMAVKTAMRSVPPAGEVSLETLSDALGDSFCVADAQRAVMLCPWRTSAWEALQKGIQQH